LLVSFTTANLPDAGPLPAAAYGARVSFDLGVWDARRPPRVAEAERRYEQLRSGEDPETAPSPRVDGFVAECEERWPAPGAADPPPFTSRRTATGLLLQVRAEVATELFGEWAAMAERHGLVLFDPQSGVVRIPSRLSFDAQPPPMDRGWFGRRRR
jgi:hypothetical protein